MRTMLAVCVIAIATMANASTIYLVKSAEQTAKATGLDFVLERDDWIEGRGLVVWGKIKNTSANSFEFVKIYFTAKTGGGNFIVREYTYAEPKDIGPGQIGYIQEFTIDCGNQKPVTLEYTIMGQ